MSNKMAQFSINTKRTHDMEHSSDARKDKPLQGRENNKPPVVKITNPLRQSGVLKVISINHLPTSDNKYSLHANMLVNPPNELGPCNDIGIASYEFNELIYEKEDCVAFIPLERICIRRSIMIPRSKTEAKNQAKRKKEKTEGELLIEKWNSSPQNKKFDPYGIGFGETDNLDYHKIRLCCQVFFSDNTRSEIFLSDTIVNGAEKIEIERFSVLKNETDELELHAYIKKLSKDQKECKIVARFYDDSNWFVDGVRYRYMHHDYALIFKVPNPNSHRCYFQIYCEKKDHYSSEPKLFNYFANSHDQIDSKNICGVSVIAEQLKPQLCNDWEKLLNDIEKIESSIEASSSANLKRLCQENYLEENDQIENYQFPKKQRFANDNSMFSINNSTMPNNSPVIDSILSNDTNPDDILKQKFQGSYLEENGHIENNQTPKKQSRFAFNNSMFTINNSTMPNNSTVIESIPSNDSNPDDILKQTYQYGSNCEENDPIFDNLEFLNHLDIFTNNQNCAQLLISPENVSSSTGEDSCNFNQDLSENWLETFEELN